MSTVVGSKYLPGASGSSFMNLAFIYEFRGTCCLVAQSCPTLLWPHRLYPTRLLCPMRFPRQESWSGLPFPSPGESSRLRGQTHISCTGQEYSLPLNHQGKPSLSLGVLSLRKSVEALRSSFFRSLGPLSLSLQRCFPQALHPYSHFYYL